MTADELKSIYAVKMSLALKYFFVAAKVLSEKPLGDFPELPVAGWPSFPIVSGSITPISNYVSHLVFRIRPPHLDHLLSVFFSSFVVFTRSPSPLSPPCPSSPPTCHRQPREDLLRLYLRPAGKAVSQPPSSSEQATSAPKYPRPRPMSPRLPNYCCPAPC